MKNSIQFLLVILLTLNTFAQKKKASPLSSSKNSAPLAQIDNLTAEVKSGNFQISIIEKGKTKDEILVKAVDSKFILSDIPVCK